MLNAPEVRELPHVQDVARELSTIVSQEHLLLTRRQDPCSQVSYVQREIATNDARLVRGRSAIAVLGSECCHWKTDEHSASSDEEVVGAAEPSMAMCPDGGLLMLGSSVYRGGG
jgi:hypothetical protein